jgi:serine/threonine protein phosphatase PrpC
MPLVVRAGQCSEGGRRHANQDFHGLRVPDEPQLSAKGVALALADGISSSEVARQASQAAVTSFLEDYYCTSEAWSVRKSAGRVLAACNSWLFAQTQQGAGRYDKDRGWACTFSALVLRSRTAHLFHVGDSRIWQLQGGTLEQLTTDHRVPAGGGTSYLGRALGVAGQVEIDHRAVPLDEGDTFVLTTDGVHEHLRPEAMAALIAQHHDDLDQAARAIVAQALAAGSPDNLTVQVARVERLPEPEASEVSRRAGELPIPPVLAPRMSFDGFRMVRELHASSRSHVYLAQDEASGETVVLKAPTAELAADPRALERFLLEEWVARRMDSPHLLKARLPERRRQHLYLVLEHVQGRTLAQWMVDHPRPALETVRELAGQLARGLRALHRLEMVHQDLRPDNVIVDPTGTARIIDYGSVHLAGLLDDADADRATGLGSLDCMAPECFLGQPATARSDQYSLAAIAYRMLTGRLPYGTDVARCRTAADQRRLRYRAVTPLRPDIPAWVDDALQKALHPDPQRRYADVAEFVYSLQRPDPALHRPRRVPLAERDPVRFWKGLALLLAGTCVVLLGLRALGH